jgi:hypothetical protein
MGDVPINYIEGVGGTRVSEEDFVAVGKHDVSASRSRNFGLHLLNKSFQILSFKVGR